MTEQGTPTSRPLLQGRFEMPMRALSGTVLGVAAGLGAWFGGIWFSLIVILVALAALREWHRLVNPSFFGAEAIATGLSAILAVWAIAVEGSALLGTIMIAAGALMAALISASRRPVLFWPVPWHAFGAFYIGLPSLILLSLRDQPRGLTAVGALFVAVWTADTAALISGRLIGGPKLVPVLSPNKTWAGFIGGTLAAALGEALYMGIVNGTPWQGAALGVGLALAAHAGDLFESWVKRQFRAKNTGSLIPGHGGMLDRIDSLLFAIPVLAGLVFFSGFNPFGV
jgi:phosphatidate cytidylyltransferase